MRFNTIEKFTQYLNKFLKDLPVHEQRCFEFDEAVDMASRQNFSDFQFGVTNNGKTIGNFFSKQKLYDVAIKIWTPINDICKYQIEYLTDVTIPDIAKYAWKNGPQEGYGGRWFDKIDSVQFGADVKEIIACHKRLQKEKQQDEKRRREWQKKQKQREQREERELMQKNKMIPGMIKNQIKESLIANPSINKVQDVQDLSELKLGDHVMDTDCANPYYCGMLGRVTRFGKDGKVYVTYDKGTGRQVTGRLSRNVRNQYDPYVFDEIYKQIIQENQNKQLVKNLKQLLGLDTFSNKLRWSLYKKLNDEQKLQTLIELESFLESKNCPTSYHYSWYNILKNLIDLYIEPTLDRDTKDYILKILKQLLSKCVQEPTIISKITEFILKKLTTDSSQDKKRNSQQLLNDLMGHQ